LIRVLATLLAAGALASPSSAAPAPLPGPLPGPVTLDGVGRVVPGITVAELAAAWGLPARAVPSLCTYVPFKVGPARGRALFIHGQLGAVFFAGGVRTASGIGIGSSVGTLRRSYGRKLQSETGSHFYFLTRPAHPRWQIRFDTNTANRVVQISFGDTAAVHVVAGCP
jgi:hypothetical protein